MPARTIHTVFPANGPVDLLNGSYYREGKPESVIPTKVGIQTRGRANRWVPLDSRLRGNDAGRSTMSRAHEAPARYSAAKGWLKLALGLGMAVFLISTVLPWLAEHGYAGRVIQENARTDRDASALFYTEDERTWAVLDGLAGKESPVGETDK